jgi:AraC-like DNA-binding protein
VTRTELLPGGLLAYEGDELSRATALSGRFWGPSEAELVRPGAPFFLQLRHTRPSAVTLGAATIEAWVAAHVDEPRDYYLVLLPLEGRFRLLLDDQEWVCTGTRGGICSPADPFEVRLEGVTRILCVRIEREAVRASLKALLGEPPAADPRFFPQLDLEDDRIASFERLAFQLCRESAVHAAAVREDGGGGPLFLDQLEQSLVTLLLECQPHTYSGAVREGRGSRPSRSLEKVLGFLRRHVEQPLTVEDLAEAAGVSPRTLFRDFKNELDASPMEVLREERLERIHRELSAPGAETSVTEVAFRWGFNHLGRLAGAYRERYGESPSDTLQRARERALG